MTRNIFCLLVIIVFLLSCSKPPSDYQSSGYSTAVIKGYVARNSDGQDLGNIGYPDINTTYPADVHPAEIGLWAFPNPAAYEMTVIFFQQDPGEKVRIWIVPASYTGAGATTTTFLGTTGIGGSGKPVFDTVIAPDFKSYYFRLDSLPEGYYRIYAKTNGILLWDNIVFSRHVPYYGPYN